MKLFLTFVSFRQADPSVVVSTKAPNKFSLVTWNIDGLCNKNLKLRYQHIAKIIEDNKYSVVFMQEVVLESLRYFDQTLENYRYARTFNSIRRFRDHIIILRANGL